MKLGLIVVNVYILLALYLVKWFGLKVLRNIYAEN